MKVVVCYSTGNVRTEVLRTLVDDQRRLVISAPWQQLPAATLAAVRDQLTAEELAEVRAAFGIGPQEP